MRTVARGLARVDLRRAADPILQLLVVLDLHVASTPTSTGTSQ